MAEVADVKVFRGDDVEVAVDLPCELGEGAFWDADEGVLYFVDIEGKQVHRYNPSSGKVDSVPTSSRVGTVVTREKGGLLVALENGFSFLDFNTKEETHINDPEPEKAANRFNDGKCDPQGRLWAGTMHLPPKVPEGSLYRMGADLKPVRVESNVWISNGIAWSSDRKSMYYIDTGALSFKGAEAGKDVSVFDYNDETGEVSNRRVAFTVPKANGHPDGCALDADGNLWIAHWEGARVVCYDVTSGKELARVELPTDLITSCAFGGPELRDLYITSARVDLSEEQKAQQPKAGNVFVVRNVGKGAPFYKFKG